MQETLHWVHAHHYAECYPDQYVEHYYHLCYLINTVGIAKKAYYVVHPIYKVFWKNTFASWECASDSAHRRRYDAVLEIAPRTYSIV